MDIYGGGRASGLGGAPYWRVAKIGGGWRLITPAGNLFWMRGVFNCDLSTVGGQAQVNSDWARWGGEAEWGVAVARRLKRWGFNVAAEYSSAYVGAVDQYAIRNITAPIPSITLIRFTYYSLTNEGSYPPAPTKNLMAAMSDVHFRGYRGNPCADVFDPNFAAWCAGAAKAMLPAAVATSPWILGCAIGDTDDLAGFGPDGTIPTGGKASSHLGYMALVTAPTQTTNSALGLTYVDTTVHTKKALMQFLQHRYGTIQALDSAWGASYTTFGSAGGWGSGTGLLDEDGHNAWVGVDDVGLLGMTAAAQGDLDDFGARYCGQLLSATAWAIRAAAPNMLVFGPATLNGWWGMSRPFVLAGVALYCDVVQALIATPGIADLTLQHVGDRPLCTWLGFTDNRTSCGLVGKPDPWGSGGYGSQLLRGADYAGAVARCWANPNMVGTKLWAWTDSVGEQANWGGVSIEEEPYVDFLSAAAAVHREIERLLS